MNGRKLISIVLPAKNEELNIPRCHEEITSVMKPLDYDYEVLLIDNDSSDRTQELAAGLCRRDPRWRYVKFSRDFTGEVSLAAGLHYSKGDAVIILFSDLQEPPQLIPAFLEKWREGYDVVYGVHTKRHGDSWLVKTLAGQYYRLINAISDVQLPRNAGDFRLMDRKVVNVVNKMRERNRYLRGISHWAGFRRCGIEYERRAREKGKSNAPFFYLLARAFAAIVTFSTRPLKLFMTFGLAVLFTTSVLILVLIAARLMAFFGLARVVPGLTTTHVLLLLNLGIMSAGFGVLGEYIGHIYDEAKRRPLWVVEKTLNIEIPEDEKIVS